MFYETWLAVLCANLYLRSWFLLGLVRELFISVAPSALEQQQQRVVYSCVPSEHPGDTGLALCSSGSRCIIRSLPEHTEVFRMEQNVA